MIAFDAGVLSLAIYPNAGVPNDFDTKLPIDKAVERVQTFIERLSAEKETILIPAPALAEALVPVADRLNEYLGILENQSVFRIGGFGRREAAELALRSYMLRVAGKHKSEGIESPWQKIKYDRQIVAITKTENARALYTADKDVYNHAKLWSIPVFQISDLPIGSGKQQSLSIEASQS